MIYLYQHIRNDSKMVFYIGIGNKSRPYSKESRNNYWSNVVSKHGYTIEVIKKLETWDEAAEWERFLISLYGCAFDKTGPLVNMTYGGEGSLGRIGELHPFYGKKRPEHSDKLKGRSCPDVSKRMEGEKHYFYGKKFSESHRKNISNSLKGKRHGNKNGFYDGKHTDESKKKMSEKRQLQIIDIRTGEVAFNSLKEASVILGIKPTTLSAQLRGKNNNKTNYMYRRDT